ncbi:hypothetical protein [Brevibacillus sp. HB1.2]|uniref:hypothetical protein n=1 Tax=Brevibacillus sp. HB1.2 TaxID=2738807 RepID=UPI0035302CA4
MLPTQKGESLEEYLGGLKLSNKTGKPVTMYDLLTYTSGIDLPDGIAITDAKYIDQEISMDEYLLKTGSKFDPTGTMTQGEFTDALIKAQGQYVFAGSEDGIRQQLATGIPNLNPSAPITRQVAAVMIQNLKQLEPMANTKTKLQDADAWAKDAITALVSQGIVDPDTKVGADGSFKFRAKDLLKRQEASALLDLAFGYYSLPIKRN